MTCETPTIQQRVNDPWGFKCNPQFALSGETAKDSGYIEATMIEHLKMGAANANVFKLLGIHEQGKTIVNHGDGVAITSGEVSSFPAANAFEISPCGGWKSPQKGNAVITQTFIGFDYGPLRACDQNLYSVDTKVTYHVTKVILQQGALTNNRASKIRVERSQDGTTWFGVDIITCVDDALEHTYVIKHSTKSRFWRLRPIVFNGGVADSWAVIKLSFSDDSIPSLDNIQDEMGFLEARDRDYNSEAIQVKMWYELVDTKTELSSFGVDSSNFPYSFIVGFIDSIRALGRPIVIGDIIELPNEAQYTPTLREVKKYLEVSDVSWATEGYTPNWRPVLQRIIAYPIIASQETMDVIDGFRQEKDSIGYAHLNNDQIQDLTSYTSRVFEQAEANVPEMGSSIYNIAEISDEVSDQIDAALGFKAQSQKLNVNPKGLYVEDGLPPNGEKFTEGNVLPPNPKNNAYHRLTYLNNNIPPRLFKYNTTKSKWIFVEADRRQAYNRIKPSIQQHITSPNAVPSDKITK